MQKLCKLTDIGDGDARGFDIALGEESLAIVCVRQGENVFAYKNSCPHTGINLEWLPDQFLDNERQYFVCSTHGALFEIDTGYCVSGPCHGDSLISLNAKVEAGDILCSIA